MRAGFSGTFVIPWSQTDVDGLEAAPPDALKVGSTWAWRGEALRVDGPSDVLRLERTEDDALLRRRATAMVRRLVGAALTHQTDITAVEIDEPLMDSHFVVTDGRDSYTVTLIETAPTAQPLLMFLDAVPPRNSELWVVHEALLPRAAHSTDADTQGVICFTPGTQISTPDGTVAIEDLQPGDRIMTRDSGPQPVIWTGRKHMSGARFFVLPGLRPIRFRPGALGIRRPDQELLVSPDHRMLIRGAAARALFNTPEVLVPARDLVNGRTIVTDLTVRTTDYIHILLPRHEVIWANGVETESFHPGTADLTSLTAEDRARLAHTLPDVAGDPQLYGAPARRNLTASEAAILLHQAA